MVELIFTRIELLDSILDFDRSGCCQGAPTAVLGIVNPLSEEHPMKQSLVLCLASTVHLLFVAGAIAQDNILDVRENFTLGQKVTVSGVITTDENLGSVRYMQDATAAIVIYPGFDWSEWNAVPAIGDSMVVTGELTEYRKRPPRRLG